MVEHQIILYRLPYIGNAISLPSKLNQSKDTEIANLIWKSAGDISDNPSEILDDFPPVDIFRKLQDWTI